MQQAEIRSQREQSAQRRQEIASNGGKARAEKLTPERRQEIARLGGTARSEKTRYSAEPDKFRRRIAALALILRRGYSGADIERQFGWDRRDVERWIQAGKPLFW